MRERMHRLPDQIPGLSLTAPNGTLTFPFTQNALLRGFWLKILSSITISDDTQNGVASEAALWGAVSSVQLQHGPTAIIPIGLDGWRFHSYTGARLGTQGRIDAPPLTAQTLVVINECYYAFSKPDTQPWAYAQPTLMETHTRGGTLYVDFGPWTNIYTTDPTAYAIDACQVTVTLDVVNEPALMDSGKFNLMFPPELMIDTDTWATIQAHQHQITAQPNRYWGAYTTIHDRDTVPARFAEYGAVEAAIGSTRIDNPYYTTLQTGHRQKVQHITAADQHGGVQRREFNVDDGLEGLPELEASSTVSYNLAAAQSRAVSTVWENYHEAALNYMASLRIAAGDKR
jgi:hypothetical protein